MSNYGFTREEKQFIIEKIEEFMKDFPFDYNWLESGVKKVDYGIYQWKAGDIIDVQDDHVKIYVDWVSRKTQAKQIADSFYGRGGGYICFNYKYIPDSEKSLKISKNNWNMEITSYLGALRIYRLLTGKTFDGFEYQRGGKFFIAE